MSDTGSEMSLEEQLMLLTQQLDKKEQDVQLAGEIGKQLLEDNNELTAQLAATRQEYTGKIEVLEQEKYTLQRKLDVKIHLEETYQAEVESLKQALKQAKEEFTQLAEAQTAGKMQELKKQAACLKAELEKSALVEQQLQDRKEELEKMLHDAREELQARLDPLNETRSDEIADLHSQLGSLQQEKQALLCDLSDTRNQVEQLVLDKDNLRSQLSTKEQELEELQCQVTSYINSLEASRDEVQELRVQLDLLQMNSQDMNSKGNSLFSEVEDKRVEAEKKLIAKTVQLDSLQKDHEMTKDHLHKLKMQLSGLLHRYSNQADLQYLERLQQQLHQARFDIQGLMGQLKSYKGRDTPIKHASPNPQSSREKATPSTDCAEYFQSLHKKKEEEISRLQEELQNKGLMLIAENDRLIQTDRKLYETERALDKLQRQNLKLHLKLNELRMKYEPDKCRAEMDSRKVIVERIPVGGPSGEAIASSSPIHGSPIPGSPRAAQRSRPGPVAKRPALIMSQTKPGVPAIAKPLKTFQSKHVGFSDEVSAASPAVPCTSDEGCDSADSRAEKGARVKGQIRHNGSVPLRKNLGPGGEQSDCKVQ